MRKKSRILLPFRYPGGKYYAIKILKPFWEAVEHDEYREPFLGGGAVFFAKPKVKYNWVNDLHKELINCYKIMANPSLREILIEKVKNEVASKKRHKEISNILPKNNLERAFKYLYLNRTSFSGKMKTPSWGYRPKRSLPPNRWEERIKPCGEKLEGVKITRIDFEKVINSPANSQKVLMFLDPPYYSARQENHYVCHFKKDDHVRLAKILKKTKFKFFLTYDDCEDIRKLYFWAKIYEVSFFYRLDNSQDNNGQRKKGFELVITNYDVNKQKLISEFNK
jgi:DNA adenine methylase